ncbi:HVO_2922 family protein [Natronocalculus amylovorans]|uniref:YegP family protein n=1 Tax=Natronocalculus amylovorans TaxID=2917812 RepID=A0AAE3FWB2_9EURY|nr:HVO_2922 family protein [Natronocalculus amylovorans]MCL9816168.1 YegP family protein [Natronocalculus amylovorans]NUE03267.1 YegP family protein [Halorubraceae archaeon YAN]
MSKAQFELYTDAEDKFRWRLVHQNGNIIADSGEGYASKQKAEQGIKSVKQNAPDASIVETDN